MRRESLTAEAFVSVYVPAALAGKTALEIAKELGLEGSDEKISQYVTVKASQIRKQVRVAAEETARMGGFDKEAMTEFVKTQVAKVPKLQGRGRKPETANLMAALDAVLAKCNGESE